MRPKEYRIKELLCEKGLDGAIVSSPENFHYVTGFGGHQHTVSRQPGFTLAVMRADDKVPTHLTTMDFEAATFRIKATGLNFVVDPYDTVQVEAVLKEELASPEPSVIISRRPCVLLKSVPKKAPLVVDRDKCRSCKACFKIGCPSIHMEDGKAAIDPTLCVGCGLCASLCPFHAIGPQEVR